MPSKVRLEKVWTKITKKWIKMKEKYAERIEAKKFREKLNIIC